MHVKEHQIPWLLLAPTFIFLSVVLFFPVVDSFYLSLTDYSVSKGISNFVAFDNYVRLFRSDSFWNSVAVTVYYSTGTLALEFAFAFIAALILTKRIMARSIYRSVIIVPMFVVPVAVGLMAQTFFLPVYGAANHLLSLAGLPAQPWLTRNETVIPTLVLVAAWQGTPMTFLMLLAGFQALPIEPYEAATVDGASAIQRLRHITLPLLRPIILMTLTIRLMFLLKAFDMIFISTGGGPGGASQLLSIYMYKTAFSVFDLGYGSSIGVIMFAMAMVTFFYFGRRVLR